MSKKNESPVTIEAGKPIKIEAETREDATRQLNDLRKQGEADGLTPQGGFIEYERTAEGVDKFSAVINFVKQ